VEDTKGESMSDLGVTVILQLVMLVTLIVSLGLVLQRLDQILEVLHDGINRIESR
jgi:hypothetical protein